MIVYELIVSQETGWGFETCAVSLFTNLDDLKALAAKKYTGPGYSWTYKERIVN